MSRGLEQRILMETGVVEETMDDYEPSAGVWYAVAAVALFVVGGMLLANTDEEPMFFLTGGLAFMGAGSYLLLVGAVARGIQVARRWTGS